MKATDSALRSLLLRIGLSVKEVEIYLAILTLKSARATEIAKLAGESRSHTYLVLRELEKRGLVSEVERGKVIHFTAESPESLLNYLEVRRKEIDTAETLVKGALPLLKSLTTTTVAPPRVTLLHGLEGMRQVYREVLPNTFCGLFNSQTMYDTFGESIVQMTLGKNAKMKGRDLLVDNAGASRFIKENEQDMDYEIRLLSKKTVFETDTMIYGDVIALFSYDADQTIVRIENKNLANSFRTWFELLWKDAKKTR